MNQKQKGDRLRTKNKPQVPAATQGTKSTSRHTKDGPETVKRPDKNYPRQIKGRTITKADHSSSPINQTRTQSIAQTGDSGRSAAVCHIRSDDVTAR